MSYSVRFIWVLSGILLLVVTLKISLDSHIWRGNMLERLRLSFSSDATEIELTENLNQFADLIHSLTPNSDKTNSVKRQQAEQDIALLLQHINLRFEFVFKRLTKRRSMLANNYSERIIARHDAFVTSISEQYKRFNRLVENISNSENPEHWQENIAELHEFLISTQQLSNPSHSIVTTQQSALSLQGRHAAASKNIPSQNLADYLPKTPVSKGKERHVINLLANNTAEERIFSAYIDHCYMRYKPIHGAVQNHDLKALEHRINTANAFDISASLVNNLRQLKIPARFVYGKIQVAESDLLDWLNHLKTLPEALALLKQGGITYQVVNEDQERKSILLDHLWVEAWLEKPSMKPRWISLDASFNRCIDSYTTQWDTTNSNTEHFSLARQLAGGFLGSANKKGNLFLGIDKSLFLPFAKAAEKAGHEQFNDFMDEYEQRTSSPDYVDTNDNATYVENLPESLAYKVISVTFRAAQLPDNLRRSFQIRISNSGQKSEKSIFQYSSFFDELIAKPVKLVFQPAAEEDSLLLNHFLGLQLKAGSEIDLMKLPKSIPAYLIQLKPVLLVDKQVIATGEPVTLGQSYPLHYFSQDRFGQINKTSSYISAGESVAIHLHTGNVSSVKQWMERLNDDPKQILINTATSLSNLLTQFDLNQTDKAQAITIIYPGFLTVSTQLNTNRWLGQIASVNFGGVQVNTGSMENIFHFKDHKKNQQTIDSLKTMFSALSGQTLEYFLSSKPHPGTSISTLQVFKQALDQHVPIILLNKHNRSQLDALPFDVELKLILKNHIEAGNNILIPTSKIVVGEWVGIGYKVNNPLNATSQFIVQQLNTSLKRQQSAILLNDMTRGLAAIELFQNQLENIVFPEVYAQSNQCHNNLEINHIMAELNMLAQHILKQSSTNNKEDNIDDFQSIMFSRILDHTALYDKNN